MRQRVWKTAPAGAIVLGVTLALIGVAPFGAPIDASPGAGAGGAAQARATAPGQQKRYRATRPIVADPQTGQWRMPSAQELADTVANLATLTNRSDEGLQEVALPSDATAVDLQGGFAGVLLARPNEDGTLETRCVFTFDEGAEFLGLVEEAQ